VAAAESASFSSSWGAPRWQPLAAPAGLTKAVPEEEELASTADLAERTADMAWLGTAENLDTARKASAEAARTPASPSA
jgi:hypothetical protein